MSYRKKHVKSKINRIKPTVSIFKKKWFWFSALILIFVVVLFYMIVFYDGLQIKNIIISGNQKILEQDLKTIVLDNANTGLLSFGNIKIISTSILLFDKQKIENKILEKFPTIEKINIEKKLPQTIILGVVERKPAGVFCQSEQNTDNCFLIDNNGIIFETLNLLPTDVLIVRQMFNLKNMDNNQIFTGEEVISKSVMNAISDIQKSLKDNFQIDLKEALVSTPVRLDIETVENWKIYFNMNYDSEISSQITKLNLLLNNKITPTSRKNLRYIDLRPKDRAVVCDNKVCGG